MPPALLSSQTLRWRRRVPRLALTVAVLLVQVPLVFAEVVLEPVDCTEASPCRYPLGSAVYHLSAVAVFLSMGAIALAVLLPRAAVWVAAVGGLLLGGPASAESSFPGLWRVAAACLLALGVLDLLGRIRQDVESRGWGGPPLPYPDVAEPDELPGHLPRDEDTRWLAAGVLLVGLVASSVLTLWHLSSTATVREFEASAIRTTATVTKVSDDGYTVTVSAGGRRVELEPMASYRAGQEVPVLVDAADPRHIVLAAEPDDPSWKGGLAAVVLAAALALAGRLWSRGTRRARLIGGGAAVQLRIGQVARGVLVTTVDDPAFHRPLGFVKDLLPSGVLLPFGMAGHVDDEDVDDEGFEDDLDGAQRTLPAELSAVSDAELTAWADQVVADAADDDPDDDWRPAIPLAAASDGGEVVTVIGLHQDGDPVVVLAAEGRALVSSGGVRDPWTARALLDKVLRREGELPRPTPDDGPVPDEAASAGLRQTALRAVLKPLAPIGMPLAILLGVAVFPVVRWMLDGESSLLDLRLVFAVTLLASWLRILSGLKDAPLRPHTLGLLHSGWWFDEFIPARRVVSVVAGKDSVVLRLDDPEDALALPATCIASHATWLSEPAHADRSAATIRTWLAQATPSAATGWRRPSMTLVPGAIALIGFLLAWGWPRFTG